MGASRHSLTERFRRCLKRQALKCRHVRGRFLTAASDGDLQTVKDIVDLFPEAVRWTEGRCPGGGVWTDCSPLATALWSRNRDISSVPVIEYLLDRGAEINYRNPYGTTALHMAVNLADKEAARLLILRGADPELKDNERESPRDCAKERAEHPDPNIVVPKPDMRPVIDAALKERQERAILSCTNGSAAAIKVMRKLRIKAK
jgi:hypothetical protein